MKKEFNAKALTETAASIIKSNFGRVQAIIIIYLFMAMLFLLTEQLFTSLIENYGQTVNVPFLSEGGVFSLIVGALLAVFFFFFSTPLNIGILKWYYTQVCKSGEEYVGIIFGYYKTNTNYVNSIVFEINKLIRLLMYFVISFAPSALLFAISLRITDEGLVFAQIENAGAIAFGGVLMIIAGLIVYILLSLRYFLAGYFFVSKQFSGASECLSKSAQYMKGNKGKVIKVIMQNKKYYLLSVLIIPLVYTIPMHSMSMANCAKTIIAMNENK